MVQTIFYLNLTFLCVLLIKIDQCFLNIQYRSNHTVRNSNCLKTFETEKKHELLKVLQSGKLCGDGQIFQVWPYLNSLIIIKLPFLSKNMANFFCLPSPSKTGAFPFDFTLERDPKNIFYCQYDVENYTDQVLDSSLFDRYEYIHTESSGL